LSAFDDRRGFEFSRAIVEGKIRNQEKLVRYFAKYLKKADPDRFDLVNRVADSLRTQWKRVKGISAETINEKRDVLMGIEELPGDCTGMPLVKSFADERNLSEGNIAARRTLSMPCSITAMEFFMGTCGAQS
jgi:hypothetical protein